MSLGAALGIAAGEIGNINSRFALIGQNIANASTPDYAAEEVGQTSLGTQGVGDGAREGVVGRSIDTALQSALFTENGTVAAAEAQAAGLQPVDAAEGAPGSGGDIASLLGAVQTQFATLAGDPSDAVQQAATVSAAQALAAQINGVSDAVQTARQTAQAGVVGDVATLNATLSSIGTLSKQIVTAQAAGQSTADLENQRDAALDQLSSLVSISVHDQPNGDVLIATAGGLVLPTDGTKLVTGAADLGASVYAPGGGVPPITFDGRDVTAALGGGDLGGQITLRDRTLPAAQANLDEFAYNLSGRFAAQGLTLFSNAAGGVPSGGGAPVQSSYLGYASEIQVNPAVLATPTLVRDGTNAIAGSAGGATAFTPNPSGGPAGFSTLISRVLTYSLGADVQSGVAQPAPATSGLGATGSISAGFAAPPDLAGLAAAVVGQQATASAANTGALTDAQGFQSTLRTKLTSGSAVSIDTEMSSMITLQNAYAANADVITAVQSLWTTLRQAVGA